MLSNYIKTLIRTVLRSKSYTIINISGLALGIACSLTIFLYVHDELTFDHNHRSYDQIYRLNGGWRSTTDGSSNTYPSVGYIIGEYLRKDFPQIDKIARLQRRGITLEKPGTTERFPEPIARVNKDFFDVFTFHLVGAAGRDLLPNDHSVVITKKIAIKYFNRVDVVGETMKAYGQDTVDLNITAVIENHPDNTSIKNDIFMSIPQRTSATEDWFEYGYQTYFTLKPNAELSSVTSAIQFFTKPYVADYEKQIGFTQEHSITPLSDIRLYSHLDGENNPQASTIYIFLLIGSFILLMGCINFINLSTARSIRRAKEIGIRKVAGAVKRQLAGQFLGEVFAMTIVASVIAMLASWQLMPIVNSYSEKNLTVFDNLVFWTMLVTIIIVTTVLAGSYPSLILSSFKPIDSLKNSTKSMVKGNGLRQALVIFQFVISVALIASTLIVLDHLKFLRNKELGFDKDQVLVVHRANQATKDQVLNIEGVSHASFSNLIPGEGNTGRTIFNGWNTTDQQVVMGQVVVDHDYIELYGLELIAGRRFDREIPSDLTEGFIINETALTKLGYSSAAEAVGGKLWLDEDWGGKKGRIIGVLKDFHYNGVNSPILPFSMFMDPRAKRSLSVKIKSENIQHVLQQVEEAFKSTVPDMTFEFSFLDESFDRQYRSEDHFMTIFSFFAAVGIAIGMLGLYGLAMFMAEQRSKEVGIRKILGATEMNIAGLLTVSFMKLISISFIIAVPLAWISMEQWLERFPFRENIDPSIFLITGGTVSLIAFLSVSYQAIKAALINPVKTLRSE